MGLAAVAMLGGCAKTVKAEEAAKVADGLKISDLNIKEGKVKTSIDKLSGSGDKSEAAVAVLKVAGVKEGDSDERTLSSLTYSAYFVNSSTITALGDDGYTYTVNGTAITIEAKTVESESPFSTVTGKTTFSGKTVYRADGLLESQTATYSITLAENDVLTYTVSATATWTLE